MEKRTRKSESDKVKVKSYSLEPAVISAVNRNRPSHFHSNSEFVNSILKGYFNCSSTVASYSASNPSGSSLMSSMPRSRSITNSLTFGSVSGFDDVHSFVNNISDDDITILKKRLGLENNDR